MYQVAFAHHPVRCQTEDRLEGAHRRLSFLVKGPGHRPELGDGRIALGDAVEHGLHGHHIRPGGAQPQGIARIGLAQGLDRGVFHQLDVVPVVVPQDLHGAVALLGQLLAAPLGEPGAGGGGAVAEFSGQGLHKALSADVVGEHLIHGPADVLKDVPVPDKLLVIGGGGGDLKVIAPAGIELGVHPVQSKGSDGQDVGLDGRRLPGGIDLAGGHIFHIVRE